MSRTTIFPVLFAVLLLGTSYPLQANEVTPAEMDKMLAALSDDDFMVRAEATKALASVGAAAIDTLKSAAAHEDQETAWRVRSILIDIGITGDEAAHQQVVTALNEMASQNQAFQNLGSQVTLWREIRALPHAQQVQRINMFIHNGGVMDHMLVGRFRGC